MYNPKQEMGLECLCNSKHVGVERNEEDKFEVRERGLKAIGRMLSVILSVLESPWRILRLRGDMI